MATNTSIGRPPALSLPRLPTSFPPCTTTTIVAYFTVCLIVAQPQTASHRLSTVVRYHCWTSPIESYTLYILPTAFRTATAFATPCAPTVASPPPLPTARRTKNLSGLSALLAHRHCKPPPVWAHSRSHQTPVAHNASLSTPYNTRLSPAIDSAALDSHLQDSLWAPFVAASDRLRPEIDLPHHPH